MVAAGDAAAAASLAELLAFQGRWSEVIDAASMLIAEPQAVYAGNVFFDMLMLLGRAGRETSDWGRIEQAASRALVRMTERGDPEHLKHSFGSQLSGLSACARRGGDPPFELLNVFGYVPPPPNPEGFRDAVERVFEFRPDLRDDPPALARHIVALAISSHASDALLERFAQQPEVFDFELVLPVARVLVGQGRVEAAWAAIEPRIASWWPVDLAQVAPVVLLTDPQLSRLMTRERCDRVLATPRGPEGRRS
jgi:hypothetical protein